MNLAQLILLGAVRTYRAVISPMLGAFFGTTGGCRFVPTCSAYAAQAIRERGAIHGGWLSVKRVCRCHPWGGCGHDPVPPKHSALRESNSEVAPTVTPSVI